jgi:hypothetical protein
MPMVDRSIPGSSGLTGSKGLLRRDPLAFHRIYVDGTGLRITDESRLMGSTEELI